MFAPGNNTQQGWGETLDGGEAGFASTIQDWQGARSQGWRWSSCGKTLVQCDRQVNNGPIGKIGLQGRRISSNPPLSRKGRLGLGSLAVAAIRPGVQSPLDEGLER